MRKEMQKIFYDNKSRFGSRRIYIEYCKNGKSLSERVIRRVINVKMKKYCSLTKETVLARGKVVSIADEQDSQNWDADMFSNLTGGFYSSVIYQEFIEQIYDGIDPLDSEEFTQELITISKTFSK